MLGHLKKKLCGAAALLALMVVLPVFADDPPPTPEELVKIRAANGECLACHSEAGLKKPPKEGLDLKTAQLPGRCGYLHGIRPRTDGLYEVPR